MMEILNQLQLTLLFSVRCCCSLFVHNREGDDKMSVENEKMQITVVTNEQQIRLRKKIGRVWLSSLRISSYLIL